MKCLLLSLSLIILMGCDPRSDMDPACDEDPVRLYGPLVGSTATITAVATEDPFRLPGHDSSQPLRLKIPADFLRVPGDDLALHFAGPLAFDGGDVLILRIYLGDRLLAEARSAGPGGPISMVGDLHMVAHAVGAQGQLVATGTILIAGQTIPINGPPRLQPWPILPAVPINTTVENALHLTAEWGRISSGDVVLLNDLSLTGRRLCQPIAR